MLTRREFKLVVLTVLFCGGVAAIAQTTKTTVMNSAAIEWNSVPDRANANGSGRKFMEGPTPTLANLECHATTLKPGASNHEILKRADDEVLIVKEGAIEAYVNGQWVKLGPGSVIFNAANQDQSMRNTSDAPATYHVVTVRPGAGSVPQPK